MSAVPTAVWLMNMGGPDRPENIQPFLRNLLADPDLIPFPVPWLQGLFAAIVSRVRARKVRREYARMGPASPQLATVREQAAALEQALGQGFECVPVFRYWGESAAEARARLRPGQRVVLLSLYPHACKATTTTSLRDARKALEGHDGERFEVACYPRHPGWIAALEECVVEAMAGLEAPVILFSAHGVPQALIDSGDPYLAHIQATVEELGTRLGRPFHLSFQSRLGPTKWLEPNTLDKVQELGAAGVEELVVVPVAFTSDHIETLVEIGEQIREVAEAAGVRRFVRVPTVQARPRFIQALRELTLGAIRGSVCPGGLRCTAPCSCSS